MSFPKYEVYKDSGVEWLGEVPEHWKTARLSHLIKTRKGFAFHSSDFSEAGVSVVKASDIKNLSINEPSTFIDPKFLLSASKSILKKGNIVLSTVGSTPDVKNSSVGQVGLVPEALDQTLLNQNTVVFESISNQLPSKYLFFILTNSGYRDHLDLYAHGTANQASLSLEDMLNFIIPIPPQAESCDIVYFLDRETARIDAHFVKGAGPVNRAASPLENSAL
jgi:type I restriction enzyme, S subunit